MVSVHPARGADSPNEHRSERRPLGTFQANRARDYNRGDIIRRASQVHAVSQQESLR